MRGKLGLLALCSGFFLTALAKAEIIELKNESTFEINVTVQLEGEEPNDFPLTLQETESFDSRGKKVSFSWRMADTSMTNEGANDMVATLAKEVTGLGAGTAAAVKGLVAFTAITPPVAALAAGGMLLGGAAAIAIKLYYTSRSTNGMTLQAVKHLRPGITKITFRNKNPRAFEHHEKYVEDGPSGAPAGSPRDAVVVTVEKSGGTAPMAPAITPAKHVPTLASQSAVPSRFQRLIKDVQAVGLKPDADGAKKEGATPWQMTIDKMRQVTHRHPAKPDGEPATSGV